MNQEIEFFEQLFTAEAQSINLLLLAVQMVLATLLAYIIGLCYIRFGHSLSNRRTFSKNFPLIAVTTMIVIMIVKSSLALSLGLVGALSIVRFRTAIKEPEELAYFFMVISIGLGIGAGQLIVTTLGTAGLCAIIYFLNRKRTEEVTQNLIIRFRGTDEHSTESIIKSLEEFSEELTLRRLDDNAERMEISFDISFKNVSDLLKAKQRLKEQFPESSFSFLQMV